MTNAIRAMMIRLLAFGVLVFAATAWAQKAPIAEQIAKSLWSGFVWANRGDPLHLQHRRPGTQTQSLQDVDLGAQSQPSDL